MRKPSRYAQQLQRELEREARRHRDELERVDWPASGRRGVSAETSSSSHRVEKHYLTDAQREAGIRWLREITASWSEVERTRVNDLRVHLYAGYLTEADRAWIRRLG